MSEVVIPIQILGLPNIQRAINKIRYNLFILRLVGLHLQLSTMTNNQPAHLHLRAQAYLTKMLQFTVNHDVDELARLWVLYLRVHNEIKNITN